MDIDLAYQELFGRTPDAPGRQFWSNYASTLPERDANLLTRAGMATAAQRDPNSPDGSYSWQEAYDIDGLYEDLFGRQADPTGYQFWTENAAPIYAAGGQQGIREAMLEAATPADQAAYTRSRNAGMNLYGPEQHLEWSAYMDRADQGSRGINAMPGTFSDYGSLAGGTPEENQAALYRTPDEITALLDDVAKRFGFDSFSAGVKKDAGKSDHPDIRSGYDGTTKPTTLAEERIWHEKIRERRNQ